MKSNYFLAKLFPPIQVHVWGGFGSQLYGLLFASRLKQATLGRDFKLIFHKSGVTERHLQIPFEVLKTLNYLEVNDFTPVRTNTSGINLSNSVIKFSRVLILKFLLFTGLLATANNEDEFKSLKPWVIWVRGHYTGLKQSESNLLNLRDLLGIKPPHNSNHLILVHLRLGDLIYLQSKTFVDPDIVFAQIDQFDLSHPIEVVSDSPVLEVTEIIKSVSLRYRIRSIENLDIDSTIRRCLEAGVFIGTNSKVSVWIAIFRALTDTSAPTAIPSSFKIQLSSTLPEHIFHRITFYDASSTNISKLV
jgi:hypothetical protein